MLTTFGDEGIIKDYFRKKTVLRKHSGVVVDDSEEKLPVIAKKSKVSSKSFVSVDADDDSDVEFADSIETDPYALDDEDGEILGQQEEARPSVDGTVAVVNVNDTCSSDGKVSVVFPPVMIPSVSRSVKRKVQSLCISKVPVHEISSVDMY